MCGGDAALCQITLTTCYYYYYTKYKSQIPLRYLVQSWFKLVGFEPAGVMEFGFK